jgi:hypothetical protein
MLEPVMTAVFDYVPNLVLTPPAFDVARDCSCRRRISSR